MGKMINAVAQSVTFDLAMNRKGAMFAVVVKLHLGSIEASFAVDEITNSGVFYDHFGPERITRKAKKIRAVRRGYFDDDISPASKNMFSVLNGFVGKSFGNYNI